MLPLSGSRGPFPWFLVLTLVGVSAVWRVFVDIGNPMPAVFDAHHASLWIPTLPHSSLTSLLKNAGIPLCVCGNPLGNPSWMGCFQGCGFGIV